MKLRSLLFAALSAFTVNANAQGAVAAPRDGLTVGIRMRASNSLSIKLENLLVSSFTALRESASGTTTEQRQHTPFRGTMTLPAGATAQDFSFGPSVPSVQDVSWSGPDGDDVVAAERFVLSLNGATCNAKAPARYDAGTKRIVIQLGDIAQFFDQTGRPVPARCRER